MRVVSHLKAEQSHCRGYSPLEARRFERPHVQRIALERNYYPAAAFFGATLTASLP